MCKVSEFSVQRERERERCGGKRGGGVGGWGEECTLDMNIFIILTREALRIQPSWRPGRLLLVPSIDYDSSFEISLR